MTCLVSRDSSELNPFYLLFFSLAQPPFLFAIVFGIVSYSFTYQVTRKLWLHPRAWCR